VTELLPGAGSRLASAPFVRGTFDVAVLMRCFIIATVPAWLVGTWNAGHQTLNVLSSVPGSVLSGWQANLFGAWFNQASAESWTDCLVAGLVYHVPLFVVAALTVAAWDQTFARLRDRPTDPGWLMTAWLFALLLPAGTPQTVAALGISFGVIFGAHVFGGTGRYLISPALLGVLFVDFGYPAVSDYVVPVVGASVATGWAQLADDPARETFTAFLLGIDPGAVGTASALACAIGAIWLVTVGAASWRLFAGAAIGLLFATTIANLAASEDPVAALPWFWHIVAGNFAFAISFIATDPSSAPLTRAARWGYGFFIGVFTIVLRVLDPAHPEGSLYAILLASLCVPLLDYLVVRRYRRVTRSTL
jgi:Na+-transporting NADH:ubiquinone oxidoreductase subunit B